MMSVQILTLNLIYDISQLTIPWDHVDKEEIAQPVKWGTRGLAKFAIAIGPLSSVFDITTFLVLWYAFGYNNAAHAPFFQAGWFIESLATQALAFHVLRTRKIPFIQSRAALPVFLSTIGAFVVGFVLMFSPLGAVVQMHRVNPLFFIWWVGIIIAYILLLQFGKWVYYRRNPGY
jgi:Mg2+-importing ATPase